MKRTALSFAALLLALLLLPARVAAQGAAAQNAAAAEPKIEGPAPVPVRVTGVLRTAKGVPVPGAPVRLLHLPSGKAWMITTDENGNFGVPDLPSGRYRIEARHLGLGSTSQEVEVTSDSAAPVELTLRVSAAPKVEVAPKAEKTEKAAETSKQPEPAKPAAEAAESTTKPEGAKRAHHHKQAAEGSQPNAPEANAPQAQEKPQIREKKAKDKVQVGTADAGSRKKQKAGFQQVEVAGLPAAAADPGTSPSADTAPLGEASSSDSYLLSGGVAQASTANSAINFAGANPNSPGQAAAGQAFGEEDSSGGKSSGKAKGKKSGKAKGKTGEGDNLGGGLEALSAREQLKYLKSNRIRVTLSEYYGNSVGDSAAYAITNPNPPKPGSYRERFGAKAGGPLVIPHVYDGKDRTFFFANYELQRIRLPFSATGTVPTHDERLGDFTARGVQLYDPFSNLSGPRNSWGSTIPSSLLDPAALGLLKLIPLPNLPGLVDNFHAQGTQAQAVDRLDALVLHTLSPRFSLQFSYNLLEARSQLSNLFSALGSDVSARDQYATVGLTQNWTARLLNETRFNFNRMRVEKMNRFAFRQDLAGELGVTGVSRAPIDWGPPTTIFINYTSIDLFGTPGKQRNQTFRLMDNLAYSLSKHTLRVGAEFRRRQRNDFLNPTPRGDFDFTGLMTSQLDAQGNPVANTGWDFADFLLGLPELSQLAFGSESIYLRNRWYVAYFQDDWRIHPRFSINWGVRYELVTPYVEKYNRISNLDLNQNITALGVVLPGQVAPFSGSLPRSLLRADTNNWAPRLGIAWRPLRRGGAGGPCRLWHLLQRVHLRSNLLLDGSPAS
ncbi:MAG: carboxypeptidase regulatory-like domain-containing protein, partial [Acidobacteria bacterium]|nr:carboxypeptidase regulatory-like domain-containing protein [Acidobacteriota bacterium]